MNGTANQLLPSSTRTRSDKMWEQPSPAYMQRVTIMMAVEQVLPCHSVSRRLQSGKRLLQFQWTGSWDLEKIPVQDTGSAFGDLKNLHSKFEVTNQLTNTLLAPAQLSACPPTYCSASSFAAIRDEGNITAAMQLVLNQFSATHWI